MPKSESSPLSIQQVAGEFRLTGWVGFWIQIVLGVVASVILLFAAVSSGSQVRSAANPGTGPGLLFAVCGLVLLFASTYWSFRYTRLARSLLDADTSARPKKAETIQLLRQGLLLGLVGMLLTLLGAQAIIGGLVSKSLSFNQTAILDARQAIQSLDLFVVQANTNILMAQFAGIASSIWLLSRVSR